MTDINADLKESLAHTSLARSVLVYAGDYAAAANATALLDEMQAQIRVAGLACTSPDIRSVLRVRWALIGAAHMAQDLCGRKVMGMLCPDVPADRREQACTYLEHVFVYLRRALDACPHPLTVSQ